MNALVNRKTKFISLGLIDYQKAWDYQASLFNRILEIKKENRNRDAAKQVPTENYLVFCEHPHVFTLGKSGDENNLKIKKEELHTLQATYYHTNRGGDITYHGPGQLVVYPILDLENFFTDIHKYMRLLEEAVIQTLNTFSIPSGRIQNLTGVWMDSEDEIRARKICAMGVKTSRWVTMHGLALNITSQLEYFDYIVPCGVTDKGVTSMEKELGHKPDMNRVADTLKQKLAEQFELDVFG